MKKIIIIAVVLFTTVSIHAQKNNYIEKRAKTISEHIITEMNLTKDQATFIKDTLYKKYSSNASKIKGKNLSKEEKKEIYRASFIATRKKLSEQFSKKEITQISKLERLKQKELNN
tara:strand:+ start:5318 stop:5665 length:348 start_codon:yes stop_codon:yes gene_type:complete